MRSKINSKEYLDTLYAGDWRAGYNGALPRLKRVVSLLPEYKSILDVGCAGGDFLKMYNAAHPITDCYGIDISPVVITQAQELFPYGQFQAGDVYALPFADNTFDMVNCQELLEHLQEPEQAIAEMRRVLKPKGDLVLTTINELAGPYEEHLWRWDVAGVVELCKGFKIIRKDSGIFDNHTLFVWAEKV